MKRECESIRDNNKLYHLLLLLKNILLFKRFVYVSGQLSHASSSAAIYWTEVISQEFLQMNITLLRFLDSRKQC